MSLKTAITDYLVAAKTDLYLYSGPISDDDADQFIQVVLDRKPKNSTAGLILTTYGGDPDAGFRIARVLQRSYDSISIFVVGPCKSAGTLIAIGGNRLVFGPYGELGPLDIQLARPDEMVLQSSGLDHLGTLTLIRSHAFAAFEDYMLQLVKKSQGAISTKTACEIAGQLVAGLFEPISAQIDPHRVSEVQRVMDIAKMYGKRLRHPNLKEGTLDQLIESFPSHSHVIDFEDCKELFNEVRELSDEEERLISTFGKAVLRPSGEALIMDLMSVIESTKEEHEKTNTVAEDPGSSNEGISGTDRTPEGTSSTRRRRSPKKRRTTTSPNGAIQQPG